MAAQSERSLDLARADVLSFARLLPHGPVVGDPQDGTLLLQEPLNPRDAALGCAWRVTPRNVGALADAAVGQIGVIFQNFFRSLPAGTTLQAILHRSPTDAVGRWSDFRKDAPDRYALNEFQQASIKEGLAHAEGGKRWRLCEVTTLVTARLSAPVPDARRQLRLVSLLQREKTLLRRLNRFAETVLAEVLEELGTLRSLTETVFSMAGIGFERLDCAGIQREACRLLHPWQRQYRCYTPEEPMRGQVLSVPARTTAQAHWEFGPDPLDWREHAWQAQVLSLQQPPARTFAGMLSSLHAPVDAEPFAPWEAAPDLPMTLVTQVGVPDQTDERARLRQKRNFAHLQKGGIFGDEDPEKERLRADLDRIMRDTASHILHTRVHLVLWDRAGSRLAPTLSAITQGGRRLGLEFLPETVLGPQIFLQCLPLGCNLNWPKDQLLRRSRRIPALAAAHLLPLYGDYTGSQTPVQLYSNRRGEAVTCDFFDATTAPHTIVTGKSRSGKSFLVNHLIQQTLPLDASIVILDRWASYDTTCDVYKGEYVDVDIDRPICLNPFAGDLGSSHRTFLLAVVDQMASGVSGSDAVGMGQVDKAVCSQALSAFEDWQRGNANRARSEPRFRDFYELLRKPPFEDSGRGAEIALRLAQYIDRGEYAGFVDGTNELSLSNNLTIFELAKLDKAKDLQSVLLLTLMYRLMQFVTNPAARTQRKYLIMDEVWALLKHDSAASFLEEAARALARFRCCAIFMSQQLSDFHSKAALAIKGNSGNYVFLEQNPEEVAAVSELFELTEQETRLLRLVHRREHWGEAYLWQPEGRGGIIRLVPDPFLRWLASQKPEERAARERLRADYGGDLMRAVAELARKHPLGLSPGLLAA